MGDACLSLSIVLQLFVRSIASKTDIAEESL